MTDSMTVDEIYRGYIQWLRTTPESLRYPERGEDGKPVSTPALLPDKVALAALEVMFERALEDVSLRMLLTVFRQVDREFNKGYRCSACGEAEDPEFDHGSNC